MKQGDYSYCPFMQHNGLLMECNWCDALCKKNGCPYFPTLEDVKKAYNKRWQEVGEIMRPTIEEMRRKIKEASKNL